MDKPTSVPVAKPISLTPFEELTKNLRTSADWLKVIATLQFETAKKQTEMIKLLQAQNQRQPAVSPERGEYNIRELDLTEVREDDILEISGTYITATTTGDPANIYFKFDSPTNDIVYLNKFNSISLPFTKIYLSNTAQSGKTLTLFIGYKQASAGAINPIQGGYEGAATNLSLDTKGRILAILADPEDALGNSHYMGAAELAARLGSPSTYDRRGDVYWWDDFENGIEGWEQTVDGTGALISWTADKSLRGGFSMKVVAGSDGLRKASVKRSFAYPLRTRLGFEMAWTLDAPGNMDYFQGFITLYTGATKIQWGFKTDLAFNYVWTGGMWVVVSPHIPMSGSTYLFYPAKVVADASTFTYVRFLAGPMSFPVKGLPCSFIPDATLPRMELVSEGYSKPGMNAVGYFDSVILTQNEPAEP